MTGVIHTVGRMYRKRQRRTRPVSSALSLYYHRVLLRMRDLLIYNGVLSFLGLSVKPEYGSPTTRNAT